MISDDLFCRAFARFRKTESIGLGSGLGLSGGGGVCVPALDLAFTSSTTLDSRITFSRGSLGMLVDSGGRLTYAPNNRLTYSEDLTNAAWLKNNVTAPEVGKISAAGTSLNAVYRNFAPQSGVRYIISFSAKPGSKGIIQFGANAAVNTVDRRANFDVANGVLGAADAELNAGIAPDPARPGYYRCWCSFTGNLASGNGVISMQDSVSAAREATSTAGDIYLTAIQLEAVTYQTIPAPYVATTSTSYHGPRFDHDPVTQAPRGLLIEEQRTNLSLASSDLTDPVFAGGSGVSIIANQGLAPDGTETMDLMQETTATSTHAIGQTTSITAGLTYALSRVVKKGPGASAPDIIQLTGGQTAFGASQYANFNISAGTITASAGGTAAIVNLGGGRFRLIWIVTAIASGVNSISVLSFTNNNPTATRTPSYAGTATANVLVWGDQAEMGSFATSYIPTGASQVTRLADAATMSGANFSNWYNQAEGTFVAKLIPNSPAAPNPIPWSVSDGTANERIILYPGGGWTLAAVDGGVTLASLTAGVYTQNTVNKISCSYKVDEFAISVNGAAPVVDTSGTLPSVTKLEIGSNLGASFLNGWLCNLIYWRTYRGSQISGL